MPELSAGRRAKLPDSAFAYVDSQGQRRLPIHDESHVRNALARFNQVKFESEAAKERARKRLLNAAKKYKIVPVGFITGQLEAERELGEVRGQKTLELPTGFVTLMMTDIEGSTALVHQLGERYGKLLEDVRKLMRNAVHRAKGLVIDARADEFFAVFVDHHLAIDSAVGIQRRLSTYRWPRGIEVRVRVGIHSGEPTLAKANYIGVPVHTTARVCALANGGQILVSAQTRETIALMDGIGFRDLGHYDLRGLPEPVRLFQVEADGLAADFPPPASGRTSQKRRISHKAK
ncbi:MAG: adenylate/guanylate cyclase domain-containing protein [Acidimicrobiia bacterium]